MSISDAWFDKVATSAFVGWVTLMLSALFLTLLFTLGTCWRDTLVEAHAWEVITQECVKRGGDMRGKACYEQSHRIHLDSAIETHTRTLDSLKR